MLFLELKYSIGLGLIGLIIGLIFHIDASRLFGTFLLIGLGVSAFVTEKIIFLYIGGWGVKNNYLIARGIWAKAVGLLWIMAAIIAYFYGNFS